MVSMLCGLVGIIVLRVGVFVLDMRKRTGEVNKMTVEVLRAHAHQMNVELLRMAEIVGRPPGALFTVVNSPSTGEPMMVPPPGSPHTVDHESLWQTFKDSRTVLPPPPRVLVSSNNPLGLPPKSQPQGTPAQAQPVFTPPYCCFDDNGKMMTPTDPW